MASRQRFESHDAASAFILSAMATVMGCGSLAPYDSAQEAAEESDNEWASNAERRRRNGVDGDDDQVISKEVQVHDDEWRAQAVVAARGCVRRRRQKRLAGLEELQRVLFHGSAAHSSNWQWSSLRACTLTS